MHVNTDFSTGSSTDWSITTSNTDNYYYSVWYTDHSKWDYTSRPVDASVDWSELMKALNKEEKKEDNTMRVYEVIVVDAKECEILKQQNVIAKDTETAMLEVDLTLEIRKQVKKGEVKFIFNELGSFEKVERQIRVKELVEE